MSLRKRLKDAAHAFLHGLATKPVLVRPSYTERLTLRPVTVIKDRVDFCVPDRAFVSKNDIRNAAKERIAKNIGMELLNRGGILLHEDELGMCLFGRAYVYVPEEGEQ